MTDVEIMRINSAKKDFSPGYIRLIDIEWQNIIRLFENCRYDLSKIRIVKKEVICDKNKE